MNRRGALCLVALLAAGMVAAVALAGTQTTVTACATTPAQTISDNGTPIVTVPAATACTTVTYTIPTITETIGTTTTPPPTPSTTPGIGVLNESGKLTLVANPGLYSIIVGGAWGSDVANVIEKAPGRGLVYFDGTDVRTSFSTGVTYTQALNNGWLLKDSAGAVLVNNTYGSYCVDIGSSSYQQAWITNVLGYLAVHAGVDGVFIDNVLYDPKGDCGSYPQKYPTTATWDTAMLSFAKTVYAALHAHGYYVALNAGAYKAGDTAYNDGTSTVNWWKQLGASADGLMNEYYDETSNTLAARSSAAAWYGDFDGWQRLIGTAQGMGDDFLGLTKGAVTDTAKMAYAKASFLLEWDGGAGAFIFTAGDAADPTNTAWTTNIGQPTAAKIAVGVGYERAYTAGLVLVNPSPSLSQTFTVGGSSYTVAPISAKIIPG